MPSSTRRCAASAGSTSRFERARGLVTQRERREGFDPSNPQIAGGSQVLERLGAR